MFIWAKKVISNDKWLITYEDWKIEKFSEEYANYLISDEMQELDKFRFHKWSKLVWCVLEHFRDWCFTTSEIWYVLDTIQQSVRYANDRAVCKLFDCENPSDASFAKINELSLELDKKTA